MSKGEERTKHAGLLFSSHTSFLELLYKTSGADGSEHADLPNRKPSASRC